MAEGMTPDIEAFFQSGEIPAALQAEADAAAAEAAARVQNATPTPAPAPTPAPTPAPAATPTPVPDPFADLRVTLESERQARAQLEAQMARIAANLERANAPAPTPAPDPTTDPLGAMMHQMKTIQDNVESLQTKLSNAEMQSFQQNQFQTFVGNLQRVRDEFTKVTPDFPSAYTHLQNARREDLRDAGVPENQIQQAMIQDEIAIAQNAITKGKNPAEVVYNMAKRRGYNASSAPAPTPSATPAATPAERIKQAATMQTADAAPARGATDNSNLTAEGLRDADDASLSRVAQDDKLWDQLVGGKAKDIFHR